MIVIFLSSIEYCAEVEHGKYVVCAFEFLSNANSCFMHQCLMYMYMCRDHTGQLCGIMEVVPVILTVTDRSLLEALFTQRFSSHGEFTRRCYVETYKMYKLCIQIHTLLPGRKSPWYSKGHTKCKQVTWSILHVY